MLYKENAIRVDRNKQTKTVTYVFLCSDCGKEIRAQTSAFKRHSGKCMRCGHLGEPYLFIYNELKNHRNKKVPFTLTFEEFKSIISDNNCHYCGDELTYHLHSKVWNENKSRAHQLDRKDNSRGYEVNNVVPCCWTCNRLKSDAFTYEEFLLLSPSLKEIKRLRKCNTTSE